MGRGRGERAGRGGCSSPDQLIFVWVLVFSAPWIPWYSLSLINIFCDIYCKSASFEIHS